MQRFSDITVIDVNIGISTDSFYELSKKQSKNLSPSNTKVLQK